MSLRPSLILAAAAAASVLGATTANAAPTDHQNCFLGRDWESWSAPGDGDTILIRVGLRDIYRVDLTPGSHVRKDPDRFLITKQRGSSWICSPLDLDLTLSDTLGFHQPLFPISMRKLSKAEVAALPRKDRP